MSILDRFTKKKDEERRGSPKKAAVHPASLEASALPKKQAADGEGAARAVTAAGQTGQAYRILAHPLVSEKAVHGEAIGNYTFVVNKTVNKTMVKNAVKLVYGVLPVSVRVVNVEGKRVRFGRSFGKRQDWKKAIVKLPKGKTLSIHEGV